MSSGTCQGCLATGVDEDSAGLERLEPDLGVGVTAVHPLLGKPSHQEPNSGAVRTRMRVPSKGKGLCWGKAKLSKVGGGRRGALRT